MGTFDRNGFEYVVSRDKTDIADNLIAEASDLAGRAKMFLMTWARFRTHDAPIHATALRQAQHAALRAQALISAADRCRASAYDQIAPFESEFAQADRLMEQFDKETLDLHERETYVAFALRSDRGGRWTTGLLAQFHRDHDAVMRKKICDAYFLDEFQFAVRFGSTPQELLCPCDAPVIMNQSHNSKLVCVECSVAYDDELLTVHGGGFEKAVRGRRYRLTFAKTNTAT